MLNTDCVCYPDPNVLLSQHLLDKMNDCMTKQACRLPTLTLLGHVVRKQPSWIHKIARYPLLLSLLKCLKVTTQIRLDEQRNLVKAQSRVWMDADPKFFIQAAFRMDLILVSTQSSTLFSFLLSKQLLTWILFIYTHLWAVNSKYLNVCIKNHEAQHH